MATGKLPGSLQAPLSLSFRDSWARREATERIRPATADVELGSARSASARGPAREREQSVCSYWGGGSGNGYSTLKMKVFEPVSSTVWSITGRSFGLCPCCGAVGLARSSARACFSESVLTHSLTRQDRRERTSSHLRRPSCQM